jgi:YD repeat-containing protein
VDSDGNETHYVNNGDGETTVTTDPLGNATTTVFDAAGRETSVTDADGRVIDYSYDNGDRLTGEVWLSNSGVTLNIVTNTYDNNDNLLTATGMNGTVTYTYDGQDRVQSYTNIFGQVLTYTYNADDEVTQRTDSLGGVLTNVYDNDDRLTTTEFSGTGATGTVVRVDFAYDNRDDQTGITWFSDLGGTATIAHSAYAYDNADRLTSITNTHSSSTVLSAYTYTYDAGDRVTAQQHWSEVGTTVYSGVNSDAYDANNQLLSDGASTYSYDSNGNRTMTGYARVATTR